MKVSKLQPAAPALFASVRRSRDTSLAAFAIALLAGVALHAGAFLPRLSPSAAQPVAAMATAPVPAHATTVVATQPVPCEAPRG